MKSIISIIFLLLLFPAQSLSASWLDVGTWMGANPSPAGSSYWVESIIDVQGQGYRIWERPDTMSASISYRDEVEVSTNPVSTGHTSVRDCTGNNTSITGSNLSAYIRTGYYNEDTYCDGSTVQGTLYSAGSAALLQPVCSKLVTDMGPCTGLDTLRHEVLGVVDDCNYTNLTPDGSMIYHSIINLGGTAPSLSSCYSCIPNGTVPRDDLYTDDGIASTCYYQNIVGDPGDRYYTTTLIPSSGGGSVDPVNSMPPPAAGDVNSTSTETSSSTVNGQTETTTTTTNTTSNPDGTSSTTTTTDVQGCLDTDGDGKSDISGFPCGTSTTSTVTDDTGIQAPGIPQPGGNEYDTTLDTPVENDWTTLVGGWMASSPFVSVIQGSGVALTGSNCTFSFDLYGRTHTIDFCSLQSIVEVFGFFFFGLCGLRSVFIAFGGE